VHQFGIIKKCFDTVDARYKHEVYDPFIFTFCANSTRNHMHVRREIPSAIITKVRVIVLGGMICRFWRFRKLTASIFRV